MRLRRLTINALPGITPGFTFEPPDAGVIIVTGPNAIGKSSLARALKHLLGDVDRRRDPPALSLEAEFDSGSTRWLVRRNGGQVAWMRDGEAAMAPSLPSGDQINLYRLSMESLLAHDQDDKALAERMWRDLRGGYDLDAPRIALKGRWGRAEERALLEGRSKLGEVERRYAALQVDEARLPSLDERIKAAEEANQRLGHLSQALELHHAIERCGSCQQAIDRFPADMGKLRGNELKRLKEDEAKLEELRESGKEAQRNLQMAQQEQQGSGLADSAPQAETMARIEERLNAIDRLASDRAHTQNDVAEAETALQDAQDRFRGGGEAPNLSPDSLERARGIVEPLIDAEARLRALNQQLKLAGEPPDDAEIDQLRSGVQALRAWLAASGQSDSSNRTIKGAIWFGASALAAIAAAVAVIEQAWSGLAAIGFGAASLFWALIAQARQAAQAPTPADDAKKAFASTELEPPNEWSTAAVGAHLRRTIEHRLNHLILQKERASGAPELSLAIEEVNSTIEARNAEKAELAKTIGFDPALAGAPFHRLVEVASQWDRARGQYEASKSALARLNEEIADQTAEVRRSVEQWRATNAPPFDTTGSDAAIKELRIAFNQLRERLKAANDAQSKITSCQGEVRALERQIADVENDVRSLFDEVALDAKQRDELADRIARLDEWKVAGDALRDAKRDEGNLRTTLAEHDDLIEAVDGGEIERLEREIASAQRSANAYTGLIEERKGINTRLEEAGRSHDLEWAASALDSATAQLEEKRGDALRHQATEILLDEVQGQFTSEREPDLLRRAKERFEQVTAHEYSLELRNGNRFAARDLTQERPRNLEELSSGTRMQLLLALRLAWTEAQEQGGESLPLFLDEALTTSDEDRFAVMANTLTRLAEAGERQIFYLSARRHEGTLWRQATGTEPPVVDLAEVRFDTKRLQPEDFHVESPPSLPGPAGRDAANYAALLGVARFDPHLEPGSAHLFHLLRDDLELLHRLLATWRIATLGQLESLLASSAAEGAVPETAVRDQLGQRCQVVRAWVDLWQQGRGRPVSRAALEQSGAVSDTFIDRVAELADELQGDGTALIEALRQHRLPRFHASKTDELEHWLADEGYTDSQNRLPPDERRRSTLAAVAPSSEDGAAHVNQLLDWLEAFGEVD